MIPAVSNLARGSPVIQIIYASAATVPFSPEDLRVLLSKSRARNSVYGVGGMLLYDQGSFLQILEGAEVDVARLYASIERDPRHSKTRVIQRGKVLTRDFADWAMAFVDVSHLGRSPDGLIDYRNALPKIAEAAGSGAHKYLRFFQQGLYRQQKSPY